MKRTTMIVLMAVLLAAVLRLGGCTVPPPPTPTGNHFNGLCFSPYLKGSLDQTITNTTLDNLISNVSPYTDSIRGFCAGDFWPSFYDKAKAKGLTVGGGADIWDGLSYNNQEITRMVSLCTNHRIDFAIVGDETMDDMDGPAALSESRMLAYINTVKGHGVPVGSSQTYYVWEQHPDLVASVDFIVMNIYPYWEGLNLTDSLNLVKQHYATIAAYGKPVYIETGWPSAGSANGAAVPSALNSANYMKNFMEWAKSAGAKYWYFNSFDEDWKIEEGSVGPYWGVWDDNGIIKPENAKYLTVK